MSEHAVFPAGEPEETQRGVGDPAGFGRLWTPHRMAYVEAGGVHPDDECPFCRIPGESDEEGLVIARGDAAYVVLNLFPYNPGHLMVVPYRHVPHYDALTVDETTEIAMLTQRAIRTLQSVSGPHGFNVGMNLGTVAGAGVAAHLHQHVVPRWGGDTNFMPVIAQTRVLPQLLRDTRSRLAAGWATAPGAPGADPAGGGA